MKAESSNKEMMEQVILTEIRHKAIHLLSLREHSRKELQQKLLLRGYAPSDVFAVLDELVVKDLQSDERFVESYIHSRSSKGYGPERIRLELQQRGVSESVIDVAVTSAEINWQAFAQKAYQKKFGETVPKGFQEKIKRQRFMQYRGFDIFIKLE